MCAAVASAFCLPGGQESLSSMSPEKLLIRAASCKTRGRRTMARRCHRRPGLTEQAHTRPALPNCALHESLKLHTLSHDGMVLPSSTSRHFASAMSTSSGDQGHRCRLEASSATIASIHMDVVPGDCMAGKHDPCMILLSSGHDSLQQPRHT